MALLTIMLCILAPAMAWGYDYNDTTLVEPWKGGAATGAAWTDVVGSTNVFDTFGANYSGTIFTIFTNWNPNKDGSFNAAVVTADLFIDLGCNGSFDYAIQLDTLTGTGKVYANPAFNTSDDIFKGLAGLTYGGRYDQAAPAPVPVQTTSADTGTTSVVWTIGNGGLNNEVAIDLSGLNLNSPWCFVWGTAACSNDGFSGNVVPLPASVLLFSSGLVGLVGLRLRRRA